MAMNLVTLQKFNFFRDLGFRFSVRRKTEKEKAIVTPTKSLKSRLNPKTLAFAASPLFQFLYKCASYLDPSGMLYPRCPPKRPVGGAQYMQKHFTNFSDEFSLVAATNFSVQSSLHFRFIRASSLKHEFYLD